MIRALIVDDERHAREALKVRITAEADVQLVGEAVDGPDAVEQILALEPDLVFLDIQMPEMDGFEVLERVAPTHLPAVVFVSAHDRFALRAFDAHALDYLLKPFSRERFEEAVRRARADLARGDEREAPARLASLLDAVRPAGGTPAAVPGDAGGRASLAAPTPPAPLTRFVVRTHDRFVLVAARDVEWIESAGNYARLHARGRDWLVRATMKDLETRLDPQVFARVHRTAIVNVERVKEIRPDAVGDFDVQLDTGAVVRMSRTFRANLLAR